MVNYSCDIWFIVIKFNQCREKLKILRRDLYERYKIDTDD